MLGAGLSLILIAAHPWTSREDSVALEVRFPPPPGAARLPLPRGHFGRWLRTLPVRPGRGSVQLFDGRRKGRDVHAAVLDIDIGTRDLQQCADFAIRLHAEWRWTTRRKAACYRFTSGHQSWWKDYRQGTRPIVRGRHVRFERRAAPAQNYRAYRRWLDTIFTYAGSASLYRDTIPVDTSKLEPGDMFVEPGFPGHAVMVLDVAVDPDGDRYLLLGQSFMPAQTPHVLIGPEGRANQPWYPAPANQIPMTTPEWRFPAGKGRRFSAQPCSRR